MSLWPMSHSSPWPGNFPVTSGGRWEETPEDSISYQGSSLATHRVSDFICHLQTFLTRFCFEPTNLLSPSFLSALIQHAMLLHVIPPFSVDFFLPPLPSLLPPPPLSFVPVAFLVLLMPLPVPNPLPSPFFKMHGHLSFWSMFLSAG